MDTDREASETENGTGIRVILQWPNTAAKNDERICVNLCSSVVDAFFNCVVSTQSETSPAFCPRNSLRKVARASSGQEFRYMSYLR